MSNQPELFNDSSPNLVSTLLEQYKLYVETANGTSTSRMQANTFFLTINTTLAGFIVGVIEFSQRSTIHWWIIVTCVVGIFLCISWFQLIRTYSNLNLARFTIIQQIEGRLPANIYANERKITLELRPKRRLFRQTTVELTVPILFAILYFVLGIVLIFISP